MGVTATNLIAGPATLHVGAFGAVEPLDTAVADDLDTEVWRDLGGTNDGVTLTVSREFFRLSVDQKADSPGRRLTERDATVNTNLAEGTLENLALALGQSEDSVTTGGTGATGFAAMDFADDDPGAEPDYVAVILRGRAPGGRRRNVIVRKALSTEEVESSYVKDGQTLIPVTFSAHYVAEGVSPVHVQDHRPTA